MSRRKVDIGVWQYAAVTESDLETILAGRVLSLRKTQDETARLLDLWARSGSADDAVLDRMMQTLDISKKELENAFLAKCAAAGKDFPGGASAFTARVRDALDRRRYAKVDSAIAEVIETLGDDLEGVIRTGSSGQRYLQLKGKGTGSSAYRDLFSDDDISFVGRKGNEAAAMLNAILEREGLLPLKVKGMDLGTLRNVRGLDLTALNLLEPDKFLGESGMASLRPEMLDKGAVIAQVSGGKMTMQAGSLRNFVEAKKSRMIADLLDDKAVVQTVQRFGSLTVVGSCERQIVQTHGGWENLADAEKVKYVIRQRRAVATSGAAKNIANETAEASERLLGELAALKDKVSRPGVSLTGAELSRLQTLRNESIDLAFKEIPYTLAPVIEAAEKNGISLARSPQARRTINELTTGFALLRDRIIDLPEDQVIAKLKSLAGENKELYSMLYTSFQQSKDLVQALDQWIASGGTREAFLDMLVKAENRLARLQQIAARKAKKVGTAEAKNLTALEEMLGTDLGDSFLIKMAKNPAAKKVVLATLVATGGAAILKTMYDSWSNGTYREDLSNAAIAIIEFLPGGIGVKQAFINDGIDAKTALLFVKDALYLTPAWPIVLTGDLLMIAIDMGGMVKVQTQHEGLVDVFIHNGEYDTSGDKPKFIKLVLPDGSAWGPDGLDEWLFQTKAIRVKHAIPGKEYYINNLSEVSTNLLDKFYIPEDPPTQQLRLAAEQQLAAINLAEFQQAKMNEETFKETVAWARWVFGFETVCNKSPEKWCLVFDLLKKKIAERRLVVIEKVMVPHVIELAEAKYAQLNAESQLEPKLKKLQERFEELRGSSLGVDLVDVTKKTATDKVNENPRDTDEEKKMVAGKIWQETYQIYDRIWKKHKDIKANIEARTGYANVSVLQFTWTGEPSEDERKADQSKAGFASSLAKITRDITIIKGKTPSPRDIVDKQAFDILGQVVFPWRVVFDESDKPGPEEGSSYFDEYEKAIEKVKELYAASSDLQKQLNAGAQLITPGSALALGDPGVFELKFNDAALAKAYRDGQFYLTWTSYPQGAFSPNTKDLKVRFTAYRPEPVGVTVIVERRGTKPAQGSLSAKFSVTVPQDFLSLDLSPASPRPGELAGIQASVPESYFGGDYSFHYKWSCSNCKIDDFDMSRTAVTAPKSGTAIVTCELRVKGVDGAITPLMRKSVRFNVSGATPTPTPTATATPVKATPTPTATPGPDIFGTPTPTPSPTATPRVTPTASPTVRPTPSGPSEQELKTRYMNCLCRCYSGWAGHIGVWWDPENKSKPECESSGPCFGGAGAFGCTSRHSFGAPNECSKSCWESVYGKGTYDPKKADQIRREENRKHMKPLKVKLDKPTCPINLQLGETVNFAAAVEGGIPPFKVTWSGNGSPKDNTFTFANSRQPGTYPISVTVSDDEGNSATASCSVVVEAMTVKIAMAEKDKKVTFGGTRTFTATVMSGGKPARGNFYFLWQPHPEVTFAPFEYNGGNASTTKATFNRLGTARVWAVAHTRQGETLTTVGESDQIEVEVGKPELKLTLTPEKGIVGSEIKAKVTTNVPGLKEIDYRWDVSAGGKLMGQSQDSSEITFIPQSTKPVTITVNARAPGVGDDLGMQAATFTADPANVNVVILGTEGPKPQVWKPNVGLVTLEKEIAVHQFVGIKAEVSPAIDGVRYEWSVNEDTHIVGSTISQQIRVTRSQVGGGEATVIVKNKDGLELGRGTGSFSVTVSQEDIDKAKDMGGTTQKLAEAKALVAKGQLDEGITLIDQVVVADPKNTEAKNLSTKWKQDRTTIQTQLSKVKTLMDKQAFTDAAKELAPAKNLHGLYPPVVAMEQELTEKANAQQAGVNKAVAAINEANQNRDFKKALQLCMEIRSTYKLTPAAERTVKGYEDLARSHETEKERVRGVLKQGEAKFNAGDFDGALTDLAQLWVNFDEYWNSSIDPEPQYYEKIRTEARTRRDRINTLLPQIKLAAEDPKFDKQRLETALRNADEILSLQPGNTAAQGYKATIASKLARGEKGGKADDAVKRGDQLATERKWPDAVKAYDEAVKADPSNPEAVRLRGRAKREAGDLKGSLADFNTAVGLDPNNYQSLLGRGLTKYRLNDSAGAMADFDRGIQLRPDYAAGYTYRARLKLDNKDYAGAKADYDAAIRLDPAPAASWINRGLAKANLSDYRGAIADYTKAIEIDPKNAIAHNNRGIAKQRTGDLDGALIDFEKALEIDPNYKTAQTNLAKLKEQMGGGTTTPPDSVKGSSFYPVDLTSVGGRKGNPHKVKEIDVDDSSGIRLKSTDEKRLSLSVEIPTAFTASKIALVTNLDDATYLQQGATIANMFVTTDAGTKSFRIQAGVHSSEWNYGVGPKHKRVDDLDIGDNRFLSVFDLGGSSVVRGIRFEYVETGAEKWYGHAPGLVLRGITLIGTGSKGTAVSTTSAAYYQLDFPSHFSHGRKEPPFLEGGVPVSGYNGGESPIVWLAKCKAPNGDGVCYPTHFEWSVPGYQSNGILISTNLSWWGEQLKGKPSFRLTVEGSGGARKVFDLVVGTHVAEWNGGSIDTTTPSLNVRGGVPGPSRRWFINRFDLGSMAVTRVSVDLLNAPPYGSEASAVIEIHGITLVRSGAGPIQTPVRAPVPTPVPTPTSPPKPPAGGDSEIFNNGNIYGVYNAPTAPTQFTLNRPHVITSIMTYHWNNARGTTRPGTIAFRGSDGKVYGPWQTTGSPGQGGVPNAYWVSKPNITIPAGTYTIIDSDPATWAQNSGSGGKGHAIMRGYPTASAALTAPPSTSRPPTSASGRYVTAIFENRSSEAVHIFPEGQTFGPGNKIAPGEKREVRVLMTSTGRIKFTAGRNGNVITTKYWDGDPDSLTRFPRVIFDGNALLITTGLR